MQRADVDQGIPAAALQVHYAQMSYPLMEGQRARTVHHLKTAAAEDKQRCS